MEKGTVLVVDDDPQILVLVTMALEDRGYRVLQSAGGESLAVAHEGQPDLILLDILMPGMDGVAVSEHLRRDAATARIPIVVMSAHRQRATSGGIQFDDWLAKPFHLTELYAVVQRWIGDRS